MDKWRRKGLGFVSDTVEVLQAARALIADERNWCRLASYRRKGRHVQRCAMGAVNFAMGLDEHDVSGKSNDCFSALCEVVHQGVRRFNDHHSHSDVLAMFDRAIAAEQAKAPVDAPLFVPAEWAERVAA